MNEKQVMKIVYYGDLKRRIFNDRISIEFSPNDLSSLELHFREQAMEAEDYDTQTGMRGMHDTFERAYDMWNDHKEGKRRNIGEDT